MSEFNPLPFNLMLGPISPNLHTAEQIICSPLNATVCLGDYLDHPQVKTFFIAPEALESYIPDHKPVLKVLPENRHELALGPHYQIIPLFQKINQELPIDVLIWWGLQQGLPEDLEQLKIPKILMVSDWHFHYRCLQALLPLFDFVLCDEKLKQHLQKLGVQNCEYWPAYSFAPEMTAPQAVSKRDIDVIFMGNHNPHKYRPRNQYLARLASLPHKIVIRSDIGHPVYAHLLQRSKIAFNHAIRQEMNLRAYEATAAGALLLVEADNLEAHQFLTPGQSCVTYTPQNFEAVIDYYLRHDDERERIAQEGQKQIYQHTFSAQFGQLLQRLPGILKSIKSNPQHTPQHFRQKLNQVALALSTNIPLLKIDSICQLEAQLEKTNAATQTPEEHLLLLNALLVARTHLDTTDLQRHPQAKRCQWSLAQIRSEIETSCQDWDPVLVYNLAWSCFLTHDLSHCSRWLDLWRRMPVQAPLSERADFLLPLHYSGLYLIYQEAAFADATAHTDGRIQAQMQVGALFLLAHIAERFLDPNTALQLFIQTTQLTEGQPKMAEAYFEQSRLFLQQGRKDLGFQALWQGLQEGQFFPGAWRVLLQLAPDCVSAPELHSLRRQALNLFQDQKYAGFRAKIEAGEL